MTIPKSADGGIGSRSSAKCGPYEETPHPVSNLVAKPRVEAVGQPARAQSCRIELSGATVCVPRSGAMTAGEISVTDAVIHVCRLGIGGDIGAKCPDRIVDASLIQQRIAEVV